MIAREALFFCFWPIASFRCSATIRRLWEAKRTLASTSRRRLPPPPIRNIGSCCSRKQPIQLACLHAYAPLSQALVGRADAQRNRVIDANGVVLAHVYGQPDGAIAVSDTRLTNDGGPAHLRADLQTPRVGRDRGGSEQGQGPPRPPPRQSGMGLQYPGRGSSACGGPYLGAMPSLSKVAK